MENNIGQRLREYIEYCYNNIKEFSLATGVSQNQLSFYLNNVRIPGGEILTKFAQNGININWLLTGIGEMQTIVLESETTIDFLLRPTMDLLKDMNVDALFDSDGAVWGEKNPAEKLDLPALLSEECLLGWIVGNSMQHYGVQSGDILVINALARGETNEDSLVIIHTTEYHSNQFTLRYYDKKSNQLLSGSKDLAPIPYSPELIVPARITSIIRPL